MTEDITTIKDANGNYVPVHVKELHRLIMCGEATINGITSNEIVELISLYHAFGGTLPVTTEKVEAIIKTWSKQDQFTNGCQCRNRNEVK